jgi:hypothetical protein
MKHTNSGKCRCQRCEAIAAGATPAEADAQRREWAQANMQKYGWIAELVERDPDSPTGFNLHTHGLFENHDHLDFQIVVPLPAEIGHTLLVTLADRVKAGERFTPGQKVDGVIDGAGGLVKLVEATEGDRRVLRVILPDPAGKLDLGEINAQYARQYRDTLDQAQMN